MLVYLEVFGLKIPMYGLCILIGILLANVCAFRTLKKNNMDENLFIVMEGYAMLGAILGAKLLYLWVSRHSIDWSRITELKYLNMIMAGGFVFFGGLIGAILAVILAGKIHKIEIMKYCDLVAYAVPLAHGFGRVGCFMAGCCYGIPYDGPFAVVFPKSPYTLYGVKLFPIQLLEALVLFSLSLFLYLRYRKVPGRKGSFATYIVIYSIARFFLEFLRYDDADRGSFLILSTSEWISILMIAAVIIYKVVSVKKVRGEGNVE